MRYSEGMPFYRYEHETQECSLGHEFEWMQSIKADRLTQCPECGGAVQRLVPRSVSVVSAKSSGELKNLGFTKLVRRDKGVYENVTANHGEKKIVDAND